MKKQFILIIIAFVFVCAVVIFQGNSIDNVTAARPSETSVRVENVSFQDDIQPILERRCIKCHGGEFPSEGLNVETYESLISGSQNGLVIIAGEANNSLLFQKIESGEMPKRGQHLTAEQIELIRQWINEGAQNN
ncbi:MAG: hypothetical protein JNM46_07950 [Anaerolineales bacterium]|nr:hypothetical protein [Anaerolineales bacterium]